MVKTNAMRILDSAKIEYKTAEYEYDEDHLSGEHAAKCVGMSQDAVFKTLVTKGLKNGINVFCIPVCRELDLKKAAAVSKNKKVEMVHVKDLLGLTGYIRGGCSPIGMKKKYPAFFDISCLNVSEIAVSAGIRGCQIIVEPKKLIEFLGAGIFDVTV